MSFLRMSQDGHYVEIPDGSQHYIYDDGTSINGFGSHAEFAAAIGSLVDELDISPELRMDIRATFSSYFGGWENTFEGGIGAPERAEIFCQCVDTRMSGLELTDELHNEVQEWLDSQDVMTTCDFCGEEFRPYITEDETCGSDECELQLKAERWNVSTEIVQNSDRLFDELYENYDERMQEAGDAATEYLREHRDSE